MFSVENSGAPDICITLVEVFFTQNDGLEVLLDHHLHRSLCGGPVDDDPDAQERGAS